MDKENYEKWKTEWLKEREGRICTDAEEMMFAAYVGGYSDGLLAAADIANGFQDPKWHNDNAIGMAVLIEEEIREACEEEWAANRVQAGELEIAENNELRKKVKLLTKALSNIKTHMEVVGGSFMAREGFIRHSTVWTIADIALRQTCQIKDKEV